jgi:uncharacterized phiE125 gp8 family phage protein
MAIDLGLAIGGDGNREWYVSTEPTEEPITKDELKTYARIDGSAEDDLLDSFIKSVRIATENYLGRALVTQSLILSMDYWPGMVIKLPRPKLISVTEIRTVDESGTETTYSSDNYYAQTIPEPGQVVIKQGYSFPINEDRDYGGYEIEFVAGYGAASVVPSNIKEAMKIWATVLYETRVPIADPPDMAKTLMNSEKILRI